MHARGDWRGIPARMEALSRHRARWFTRDKVFADRYHAHVLASRREVANAVRCVLENFRHHLQPDVAAAGIDPCPSGTWLSIPLTPDAPVVAARTWLLRNCPGDGKLCAPARRPMLSA